MVLLHSGAPRVNVVIVDDSFRLDLHPEEIHDSSDDGVCASPLPCVYKGCLDNDVDDDGGTETVDVATAESLRHVWNF